ncbi:MAG: T9SS type A sorting domain-containing protein [Phycisphaerae bacterium]|nr:T9SS type A sorting domain-containing protein [Saprospiraceae bacterium]
MLQMTHSRQSLLSGIDFAVLSTLFHLINQFVIIMIYRFSTLALGAFLFFTPLSMNAQGFGVVIDSSDALPDQVVCLPVYAQGFTNIESFQYSLTWDANVLNFDRIQNLNLPGLLQNFSNLIAPNRLLIGWADPTGVAQTRANGSVLYEACFKAISIVGNSSDITPGGEGFPPGAGGAEAYNNNFQNVWMPALNVPGYVEIVVQSGSSGTSDALQNGQNTFQLSPNPTLASSQVLFRSKTSGTATLSVTDAAGKMVLEQKISVKTGENRFEIPANTLKAKGMYQVSLQTKEGVNSQMLSVQ